MSKGPPQQLPICSATVDILGAHWPQTSTIWSGLRLHEAIARENGPLGPRHHLAVPWCHVDNESDGADDPIYRLYAKDERYHFAKARNGVWLLWLTEQTKGPPTMTPIQDAKAEMLALRDHFNKRVNELAAEGLPFTVVADPSLPGFDVLVPVARVACPNPCRCSGGVPVTDLPNHG